MAIVCSQGWKGTGAVVKSWGYAWRDKYTVTGTSDKAAATSAIPVAIGDKHPDNTNLSLGEITANATGLFAWEIFCDYRFGDVGLGSPNPLAEPYKIRWEKVRETAPIDLDLNQNAVVDSTGHPFTPRITTPVPTKALVVCKALPVYNVAHWLTYEDTVNSDTFTINGAGAVQPGQCYCDSVEPASEYTNLAPYVFVEFRFLLSGGTNPFQAHPIDEGRVGYYVSIADGKTYPGLFCDKYGNVFPEPTRLNGAGKPISALVMVSGDGNIPASPVAPPGGVPPGLTIEPSLSSATIKTLVYKNIVSQVFTGMI